MKSANKIAVWSFIPILALALTFSLLPANALDLASLRRELAMIHLLVKAGRKEEAASKMRALFPKGPPIGGDLALEYYDVIGNTDKGWGEAKAGLEHLVSVDPYDLSYKMALARQLTRRSETMHEGLQMFADMSKNPDLRKAALEGWRQALSEVANDEAGIEYLQDYLAVDPGNAEIKDALSVAKRIVTANLPWKLRHEAAAQLSAGHVAQAQQSLRKALAMDPKNPWVRFDLARLIQKQPGGRKKGLEMMVAGLALVPDAPDMLYANALYVSLLDDPEGALKLLGKIPQPMQSDAMRKLEQAMTIQIKTRLAQAENPKKTIAAKPAVAENKPSPWKLLDKADEQIALDQVPEAMETLKKALSIDPKNPWVRLKLAHLLQKPGGPDKGLVLMKAGLALAPNDAAMLYANALYLSSIDDAVNALRLMASIPESKRTPAMRRSFRSMFMDDVGKAKDYYRKGKLQEAKTAMALAERQKGIDLSMVESMSEAWFEMKQPEKAMALMRPLAKQPGILLDYAKMLNRARQDGEYNAVVAKLLGFALQPRQKNELWGLRFIHAERLANEYMKAGNAKAAQAEMAGILADTPPDDIDKRMAIADWYLDTNGIVDARAIVEPVKNKAPFDPRLIFREARIAKAEGHDEEAITLFRNAGALDEVADMMRHRAKAYVETGWNYLSRRDGSPGISNIKETDNSVIIHVPLGYAGKQFFLQMDSVSIDTGDLAGSSGYDLQHYGTLLSNFTQLNRKNSYAAAGSLLQNQVSGSPYRMNSAKGVALGAGIEKGDLRLDVGTTPMGFPVSYLVGGVRWSHYTATTGYSLDFSRRPVTGGTLSYAGAYDPLTGQIWGGVRSTGASAHFSRSKGRLSASVGVDYHVVTGVNVLNNNERGVRLGVSWDFISDSDMQLTAGLVASELHYRNDYSNYSFGQGGYYSPQQNHTLALPLRWSGRYKRLSYLVDGSLSVSTSYSRLDDPVFPTDPALQQSTGNQTYGEGKSHGLYYSFGGALEYRVTSHISVGGSLDAAHTPYYSPNYFAAYLRYMFDPESGPVNYPPQPVRPYSQY